MFVIFNIFTEINKEIVKNMDRKVQLTEKENQLIFHQYFTDPFLFKNNITMEPDDIY